MVVDVNIKNLTLKLFYTIAINFYYFKMQITNIILFNNSIYIMLGFFLPIS